jgi:hypothetical protein
MNYELYKLKRPFLEILGSCVPPLSLTIARDGGWLK